MRSVVIVDPWSGATTILVWQANHPAASVVDVYEPGRGHQQMTTAQAEALMAAAQNKGWMIIEED